MQAPISARRGPRPWRAPRTWPERMQLAAWVQFAVVGFSVASVAFVVPQLGGLGGFCMDPGDVGCGPARHPSAAFYVVDALAGIWGIAVAGLPVLLVHVYRRGRLPLGAALMGLAVPLPAASVLAYALTSVL